MDKFLRFSLKKGAAWEKRRKNVETMKPKIEADAFEHKQQSKQGIIGRNLTAICKEKR